MRNSLPILALACAAALTLAACNKTEQPQEQAAAEAAPVVLAKPTAQQPVKPLKPDVVVKAEEAAAAAEAAAPADAPADGTTTQMDPAVAEAKAAYDTAFAQYEEQNKAYSSEWKKYLVSVVTANMQGVKSNRPYMYFVPGGNDEGAQLDRQNQLDNVGNVVARGVLPGNMMAFGGPDSAITAQLVVDAFKEVQAGSFKDVVVLFIGAPADFDTVKQALATSGADARFVEAK
ncbi:MAG TPA: hypothetical protein VIZ64_04595 [Dokdonella sp.]